MTPEDIRTAVLANQALKSMAESGNDSGIAAAISATVTRDFRLTSGYVLDLFGPLRGAAIMTGLRAASAVQSELGAALREILRLMDRDSSDAGVNLGHPSMGTILAALVGASLVTQQEADTVAQLATKTVHPSVSEVSDALAVWRPNGIVGAISVEAQP